ncbi:MAG: AAA family ATPase [Sphaerochaetaceae bacterium]
MAGFEFKRRELSAQEAFFSYDSSLIESCKEIPTQLHLIGQPRAMRALEMALTIKGKGYNIFVSGEGGSGRSMAIRLATAAHLGNLNNLQDIAYIHNFHNPSAPQTLTFKAGQGRAFMLAMNNFQRDLRRAIEGGKEPSEEAKVLLKALTIKFDTPKIAHYLHQVQLDVDEHSSLIKERYEEIKELFFLRYSVNLLVDHGQTTQRPLIFETHPTFANLFGSLDNPPEKKDEWYLPFLSIRAGSLLQAAGGFIVISAEEMLTVEGLWEAFKRFLNTSTLVIQNAAHQAGIRPEPLPLPVKVILIGSETSYDEFSENDDDFLKLFKVLAEFDYTMAATKENIASCIGYIKLISGKEGLLEVDSSGIAELLRFSALEAESREELTTQLSLISDLLHEADYWARVLHLEKVTKEAVLRALEERAYVSSVSENRIFDEISSGEMIIALEGSKVGVVNGLAILDRGGSSFGTPTVISATVAPGNEGIVNIEHEAGLSGEIHDKGLLILEGYLRKSYARNFPLSIYAGICFEQSYGEVDGDSASSSELYALLSAIGEIPIKQNIAVTGSVNQMGELQPVGGINEKISGFFNVCKRLGLKGHPGVIIPVQNIKSLILPYEIIEAIERKEFHIYPIQTIDEGMEILTDRPSGKRNHKGNFPVDTLNRTIEERLRHLYELSRPQS